MPLSEQTQKRVGKGAKRRGREWEEKREGRLWSGYKINKLIFFKKVKLALQKVCVNTHNFQTGVSEYSYPTWQPTAAALESGRILSILTAHSKGFC